MKKGLTLSKSNKLSFILISLFSIACLRVCAETITMPTEEAKKIRQKLCVESKTYIGCPYVYGAHGPSSFDCSGLIYYIAKKSLKIFLPRTAKGMYDFSDPVSDEDREPGDLVFFQTGSPGIVTHVGIYLGENKFISALSAGPKRGVVISSLTEKYWEKRYLGTRKFLPSGDMKEKTENENLEPSNLEESSEILTQQAQEGQANYSNNSETQEGQAGNSDNSANQQVN